MFTPSEKKILLLIAGCFVVGIAAKKWEAHWVEIPELASAKTGQAKTGQAQAKSAEPDPTHKGREKTNTPTDPKPTSPPDSTSGTAPSLTDGTPESAQTPSKSTSKTDSLAGLVNVNQASRAQLMEIKGIGPKTADKIIKYRQRHGPFTSLDQLVNIKGIGKKKLQNMRPFMKI